MSERQKPDGGPAFLSTVETAFSGQQVPCSGMTMRQWYAGMALQGLIANIGAFQLAGAEDLAQHAFKAADAMLTTEAGHG